MRIRMLFLAALFILCGCSQEPYTLAPVSGKVTLDGQPLADAYVSFQPLEGRDPGPGSYGKTDAQGEYTLKVVGKDRDGAVVGKHRVAISLPSGGTAANPSKPLADAPGAPKERLPAKYNIRSELTCDVPKGGTKAADFVLQSK
jgi:hypothetical protein